MTSNISREHSPSNYSNPIDVKHRAAAFQGASYAFSKAPRPTKPLPNTYSDTNGAFAAASSAGLGKRREERQPDGASWDRPQADRPSITMTGTTGPVETRVPARQTSQCREQSPSHIAALLATSRATPTRTVSTSSKPSSRRPSPLQSMEDLTGASLMNQTLSADATSLVKLFESKQPQMAPITHSVRYVNKLPPSIASPTPIRPLKRSSISTSVSLRTFSAAQGRERGSTISGRPSHVGAAAVAARLAGPLVPVGTSTKRPVPMESMPRSRPESPGRRQIGKGPSLDGSHHRIEGSTVSNKDPTESFLNNVATGLRSRPARLPSRPTLPTRRSEPVAVPASTSISRRTPPSYQTLDKQISDPVRLGREITRSSDSYVPQLTVDSLANAMVASSLASSRAASPTKHPPLPPPRRHPKHSLFHHHSQEESRTPSPAKGMRQTLREPLKSDDEDDFRKHRSHRVRKHPNKHHEGDRKRYRNEVTERERKRYEGVWAANKGLLDAEPSTAVINVVVRDVWKRSRLPDDMLEEVWDLVDTQLLGKLEKEEFVVGLFLIDQRLKGNKLPSKVSDSIWSSVRRLSGINVPRNRR